MENDALVIKSKDVHPQGRPPEDILSNLCHNDFCYDKVQCSSMESFLLSLKYQDEKLQHDICFTDSKYLSEYDTSDWQKDQILWWKGLPINRQSPEYLKFISDAYKEMYLWCGRFRDALMATLGKQLSCDSGRKDPYKAILTDEEFCKILTDLREEKKDDYKKYSYPRRWPNSYGVDEDYV